MKNKIKTPKSYNTKHFILIKSLAPWTYSYLLPTKKNILKKERGIIVISHLLLSWIEGRVNHMAIQSQVLWAWTHRREIERDLMAAITTAVIAIAGIILGWITIEMACKPCLEKGREAIDRSLNPDYDPDDEDVVDASSAPRAPLLTNRPPDIPDPSAADPSTALKSVWSVRFGPWFFFCLVCIYLSLLSSLV